MIFKCEMCGGDLLTVEGSNVATCDSCGTQQTLPAAADEQKANLFNRANHLRRSNDFDRAVVAYESLLNIDDRDAEAHWGLLLSRYGIEYIEDPQTHEMVPTCHRVQSDSILSDADYKAAVEYAPDDYAKRLYESDGQRISQIQRDILAISSKEEPFDVFICYKETSDSGTRTKDSTLAQDIYYQLTKENFKVFFARITLESTLGQQYEPYIFAALNSAKVMLVIGTKPEYFNAIWVKNEWSRFLALAKKDRSKLLIPCYSEMDAYELPEELSMLQSQDMSKIGFLQDLLRGVQKVLDADKTPVSAAAGGATGSAAGVESLHKRGLLFLEEGDFTQADEYFNKVLDIAPEYAPAYVGKLCVDKQVKIESELANLEIMFDEDKNYKYALRFADETLRSTLSDYAAIVAERQERQERQEEIYNSANKMFADSRLYSTIGFQLKRLEEAKHLF